MEANMSRWSQLKHLKDIPDLPAGWDEKCIAILLDACVLHISDLHKNTTDNDAKWHRIAIWAKKQQYTGKETNETDIFSIDNCIEAARSIHAYVKRNLPLLFHDIEYVKLYRNVKDLLKVFPPVKKIENTPSPEVAVDESESSEMEAIAGSPIKPIEESLYKNERTPRNIKVVKRYTSKVRKEREYEDFDFVHDITRSVEFTSSRNFQDDSESEKEHHSYAENSDKESIKSKDEDDNFSSAGEGPSTIKFIDFNPIVKLVDIKETSEFGKYCLTMKTKGSFRNKRSKFSFEETVVGEIREKKKQNKIDEEVKKVPKKRGRKKKEVVQAAKKPTEDMVVSQLIPDFLAPSGSDPADMILSKSQQDKIVNLVTCSFETEHASKDYSPDNPNWFQNYSADYRQWETYQMQEMREAAKKKIEADNKMIEEFETFIDSL